MKQLVVCADMEGASGIFEHNSFVLLDKLPKIVRVFDVPRLATEVCEGLLI
ncbi:MAG: hypothetical protein FWG63_04240 [Defluviitaleaceae bacterium]|nr:hypothetical protein [Defluviitaleaceae bacterium]